MSVREYSLSTAATHERVSVRFPNSGVRFLNWFTLTVLNWCESPESIAFGAADVSRSLARTELVEWFWSGVSFATVLCGCGFQ